MNNLDQILEKIKKGTVTSPENYEKMKKNFFPRLSASIEQLNLLNDNLLPGAVKILYTVVNNLLISEKWGQMPFTYAFWDYFLEVIQSAKKTKQEKLANTIAKDIYDKV